MTAAFAWVLVFVLNGNEVRSEPMGGEACVLKLLDMGNQGTPPYCLNTVTQQVMNQPKPCIQVQKHWCRV